MPTKNVYIPDNQYIQVAQLIPKILEQDPSLDPDRASTKVWQGAFTIGLEVMMAQHFKQTLSKETKTLLLDAVYGIDKTLRDHHGMGAE